MLWLGELGARRDVFNTLADGGFIRLDVGATSDHASKVLAALDLLAGGTHCPRGHGESAVGQLPITPPRPAREHRAAAFADRRSPPGWRPGGHGGAFPRQRSLAAEAANASLTLCLPATRLHGCSSSSNSVFNWMNRVWPDRVMSPITWSPSVTSNRPRSGCERL